MSGHSCIKQVAKQDNKLIITWVIITVNLVNFFLGKDAVETSISNQISMESNKWLIVNGLWNHCKHFRKINILT